MTLSQLYMFIVTNGRILDGFGRIFKEDTVAYIGLLRN